MSNFMLIWQFFSLERGTSSTLEMGLNSFIRRRGAGGLSYREVPLSLYLVHLEVTENGNLSLEDSGEKKLNCLSL